LEVAPSLQVTVAAASPEAAAGAVVAAVVAGALAAAPADLFMPPCPLQAPWPPFEVVPSLQVTSPAPALEPEVIAPVEAAAAGAAGAAALDAAPADLSTPP
jgi:hypothetical protein